jgi:TNF receptor-associated factor 4
MTIQRQELDNHCKNECELRPPDKIPCEFNFAGCSEMIPPDEMEEHLEKSVKDHLSLVATSYLSLRERLMEMQAHFDENNLYIEKLQKERREMQDQFLKEVQEMRAFRLEFDKMIKMQGEDRRSIERLQNYSSILPIVFTLDDYENRRVKGDMGWSSPPFYTHMQGYRMCLWVDIGGNGPGKGIYISVFLSLTKGEYDAKLKWPFRGSIIIQLLNQQDEEMPHTEVIKYHDHTPNSTAGRVMEDGRMSKPWGKGKFMRHDELLAGGFIKNDILRFQVSKLNL